MVEKSIDDNSKEYLALVISYRVNQLNMSLLKILPNSENQNLCEIDWQSGYFFLRNLIENYCHFFYLCGESYLAPQQLKEGEIEFRLLFWHRHALKKILSQVAKIRIEKEALRKKGQYIPKDEPINHLEDREKQIETEIKLNHFYKHLIDQGELKKELRSIKDVIFCSNKNTWRKEICKRAKLNENDFDVIYDDCSQYIHSDPFAVHKLSVLIRCLKGSQGIDKAIIRSYNMIVIYYIRYLAMFISDLFAVFPAMEILAGDTLRQELKFQARVFKTDSNT